jgi:hypothetical protein
VVKWPVDILDNYKKFGKTEKIRGAVTKKNGKIKN